MTKRQREKQSSTTLHRKLNIEQQEFTKIRGKDPIVIVTNGTYPWSFVSYSVMVNQDMMATVKRSR